MGWLINTIVTLLLGVVIVPLAGFAAGPVFGLATVAALVIGYQVAKRSVPAEEWRGEYAWSFLAPTAGFFLSRRLRQRNELEAARVSWRLMLVGGAFLYALGTVTHLAITKRGDASLARTLASPDATSAEFRKPYGHFPLEGLQRSRPYKALSPERQAAVDAEWREAQTEYYREQIRERAPHATLDETRWKLHYDRLRPSQQAALDDAWKSLQRGKSGP